MPFAGNSAVPLLSKPTCSLSRPTAHPNHIHKLHVCSPPLLSSSSLSLSPFPIRPTDRHSQTDTQSFVFPVAPTTTTIALALAQCVYDVRTFRARAQRFPLTLNFDNALRGISDDPSAQTVKRVSEFFPLLAFPSLCGSIGISSLAG